MNECDRIRARVDFYLDDELRGAELVNFDGHLESCRACRAEVERERDFLEGVRQARPLYQASPELRDRASAILADAPAYASPPELIGRVRYSLSRAASATFALSGRRTVSVLVSTAALIALLAVVWYVGGIGRPSQVKPPSSFAVMAVDNHLRHLRGQLPFEVTSDSPLEISRWFAGKVAFSLELPNYQESSGQDRLYRLEGARLVGLENDYAAYVGYRMGARPISLVVTSDSVAKPAGGEEIISKGVTFHYDSFNGLKVITWSDRGLTYALVSDLEERGQQSCVVCHEGTRDRDFIEGLKPGR